MEWRKEEGSVVVVVTLAIALLTALSGGLIVVSSSEAMIAANFRAGRETLYSAEAMLERAFSELRGPTDWNQALNGAARSSFVDGAPAGIRQLSGGVTVDLSLVLNMANCGKSTPCSDAEMNAVTSDRPWGTNNPRWQLYAFGPFDQMLGGTPHAPSIYVLAMVGDDGSENDGNPAVDGLSQGALPNPGRDILMIRAEAFGPRASHHVVEATIERFPLDELVPAGPTGLRMLSWREGS
jgi:hypothetical protein